MKCFQVDGTGVSGVRLGERSEPPEPARGQVLLKVNAVSLNYRDLLVAKGKNGVAYDSPFVAASDMSGSVVKVGAGITEFKAGDRVINAPFHCWPAGKLRSEWAKTFVGGAGVDGVLAERVIYPAESLVKMPLNLTFEEASTLTNAGLTAWAAVVTHGRTRPGEWVLLHGTGGVSIFAAQIAGMLGARIILTTSNPEKAKLVKERFGVLETFNYNDERWPEKVIDATGGRGVDIVVDVVGGATLVQSLKACGIGARVGVIGILGGLEAKLNTVDIIMRQLRLRGIFMESAEELRALARALEANDVHPFIDKVFPFEQTPEAYRYLESQRHMGKVVIKVNPAA